jgi:hypothetical protein
MAFYIKIEGQAYRVEKEIIVGRGVPFDCLLDHRDIARAHCRIERSGKKFYITDLGSTSGTFVNGVRLTANKRKRLRPADRLRIGEHQLEFQRGPFHQQAASLKRFQSHTRRKIFLVMAFIGFIYGLARLLYYEKLEVLLSSLNIPLIFILSIIFGVLYLIVKISIPKQISEVSIGSSGVTLFFKNDNMSIPYEQLKLKYFSGKNKFIIEAFGRSYFVQNLENCEELFSRIKSKVGQDCIIVEPRMNGLLALLSPEVQRYSLFSLIMIIVTSLIWVSHANMFGEKNSREPTSQSKSRGN